MINIFKLKKIFAIFLLSICVFSVSVYVYVNTNSHADLDKTLSVALYPYVPDMTLFKTAITLEWEKIHPDSNLKFTSWDCYSGKPPHDLDVFVYDSIFLHDFVDPLLPLSRDDIKNYSDLFPYAIEPCTLNGAFYAVPQLLCVNFLYTRKGEFKINNIHDIYELYSISDKINNNKVFINIPDEISLLSWYFQAVIDITGQYTDTFKYIHEDVKKSALKSLNMLKIMADNTPDEHETLFKNGTGRAFIGYSEAMYKIGTDFDFDLFSLSSGKNIPVFCADIASVN